MRSIIISLSMASLLVGCGAVTPASSASHVNEEAATAAPESSAEKLFARVLEGETQVYELVESDDYTKESLPVVYRAAAIPQIVAIRHYEVTKLTAKSDGFAFTIFASYLDEEDGGNTYGWIEDSAGTPIAYIQDSFITTVDSNPEAESTPALPSMPRALTPALETSDIAGFNSLLVKLVEEYEHRPLNPSGEGEAHLDVYTEADVLPCVVGAETTTCELAYNQDRWNGTVYATLKMENGKAVELTDVSFDGNY